MSQRGEGVIAEIEERLRNYPQVRYTARPGSIAVAPTAPDGFTVSLYLEGARFTVYFNGWHETFTDVDQALNCFALGFTRECRLQEWRRGGHPYRWVLEYRHGDTWVPDSEVGLFFCRFWRRREIVYLQNDLLPAR